MESRHCLYCHEAFTPNKYSPRQKVCSKPECQKKRQLDSMRGWRQKNPNYFRYDESKGLVWLETQRKRSRQWREKNPDKVRQYRQAHSSQYRQYMREYMRQYRQSKKKLNAEPNPPSA
ncbi:MAG: hypothetical protein HY592_02180 [Candidatus Omnitrophica bacterium]|nr:hypothetical protein [Candidatus Omnitrophota bacterium]